MAALTVQEQKDVMTYLLGRIPSIGQTFTKPDVMAAIVATDAWISANKGAASSNTGFNSAIGATNFSTASVAVKTMLFCAVALKQAGVI